MSEIKTLPDKYKVADLLNIKEKNKVTREKFTNNFTDDETMQDIYKRITRFSLNALVHYVSKLEGVPKKYIIFLNNHHCYNNIMHDYENIIKLGDDDYLYIKKI